VPIRLPEARSLSTVTNRHDDTLEALFGDIESDGIQSDHIEATRSSVRASGRAATRRRRRIVVITVVVLLALLAGLTVGVAMFVSSLTRTLDANIERIGDPFADIPAEARPPVQPAAAKAVNILMIGSDSRISAGDPTQWTAGAQRTDTIMLLHVPADRSGATIMSIPRDSWVDVAGHGKAKINAAFSWGGPPLLIQTVENLTNVRMDHFVVLDFEGFVAITDALGGVKITVPKATAGKRGSFPAGTYTMDGHTALSYVRQRKNLPGGDFGRVRRQQNWIRSVAREILSRYPTRSPSTLANPAQLTLPLDKLSRSVATDDAFTIGEMRSLTFSLSRIRLRDLLFLTVPVDGVGRSPDGEQSIVNLDAEKAGSLWDAVAHDDIPTWVRANDPDLLGATVR
jgi:LCP family protein required for cell wall assembly